MIDFFKTFQLLADFWLSEYVILPEGGPYTTKEGADVVDNT